MTTAAAPRAINARLMSVVHFVALPLVMLVPLVVVVEDQGDEIVKSLDEAVGGR